MFQTANGRNIYRSQELSTGNASAVKPIAARSKPGFERPKEMLALLASLVIAGAGVGALASIALTVRGQKGTLSRLFAEARSLEQDRVFLVRMTGDAHAPSPIVFARLRRTPQRATRRVTERSTQTQRAAA